MLSAGFETAAPATKRPQTYALDRAATGIEQYSKVGREKYWDSSECRVPSKTSCVPL
jgi:hypothetical protein